jgi:hypothetical protein
MKYRTLYEAACAQDQPWSEVEMPRFVGALPQELRDSPVGTEQEIRRALHWCGVNTDVLREYSEARGVNPCTHESGHHEEYWGLFGARHTLRGLLEGVATQCREVCDTCPLRKYSAYYDLPPTLPDSNIWAEMYDGSMRRTTPDGRHCAIPQRASFAGFVRSLDETNREKGIAYPELPADSDGVSVQNVGIDTKTGKIVGVSRIVAVTLPSEPATESSEGEHSHIRTCTP